jgi:hypothetical protein
MSVISSVGLAVPIFRQDLFRMSVVAVLWNLMHPPTGQICNDNCSWEQQNGGNNLDGGVETYWCAWYKVRRMLPWFLQ